MELEVIQRKIFEIRGGRAMLDVHLAELYGVETRALKQAVRRNKDRFPDDFMFELTRGEWQEVITNCDNLPGTAKYSPSLPFAFTEQGVAMLSSVLRSPVAVQANIAIMRAFVLMRQTIPAYKELAEKVVELESAVGKHDAALGSIVKTLQQLIAPPDKDKRRIGF